MGIYELFDGSGNVIASKEMPLPSLVDYEFAVQAMLDKKAREYGYDDMKSACTYVGDPDPTFNDQATKLRAWRSACWRKCYDTNDQFGAGLIAQPTITQLIALMPACPL